MEDIQWSPAFSVGVGETDLQHQRIIGLINQLSRPVTSTSEAERVSETLTLLTKYASEHFEAEEALLAAHNYSGLEHQKEEHRAYRLRVVSLCKEAITSSEDGIAPLQEFLKQWWVEHILQSDMAYRKFFKGRNVH